MLTVAIQAGGKSTRMGEDKALIPFNNSTLIDRSISRLLPIAHELIIISNSSTLPKIIEYPVFTDIIKDIGPLGGLLTALNYASHPFVANVAVDLPFVNPDILSHCSYLMQNHDYDVAIPRSAKGLEPLHAIYRRITCVKLVENAIQQGDRRMVSWFEDANVREIPLNELRSFDPEQRAFFNINTPEDIERARSI